MPTSVAVASGQRGAQPPATVLLVDDDELVRETTATLLSAKGYRVLEAGSADEAVSLLGAVKPVDVVLTDVRMPGRLDGIGLAFWIHERRPEIRVLITSGNASAAQQAAKVGGSSVIPKPCKPDEILRRVEASIRRA